MIFFILQEGSEIKEVYFCLKANFNVSIVSLMDPKIVIEIPEDSVDRPEFECITLHQSWI